MHNAQNLVDSFILSKLIPRYHHYHVVTKYVTVWYLQYTKELRNNGNGRVTGCKHGLHKIFGGIGCDHKEALTGSLESIKRMQMESSCVIIR